MKIIRKYVSGMVLLLCCMLLFPAYHVKAADTEMTIYGLYLESNDKGESVLLESDGHYILMDLGSASSAPAIIKEVKKLGIKEIDLYFSHLHMDHYGGKSGGRGNTVAGIKQLLDAGVTVDTLYMPALSLSPEANGYKDK